MALNPSNSSNLEQLALFEGVKRDCCPVWAAGCRCHGKRRSTIMPPGRGL